MRLLLIELLHIFILTMMGSFIILSVTAAMGGFDNWENRYIRNRRGKLLPLNRLK